MREALLAPSPGRIEMPRLEKVKEENVKHFGQTFGKRPVGLHGAELPKFSENFKEFWTGVKMLSSESSSNKITIIKKEDKNQHEQSIKKTFIIKKSETFEKPTEIEFSESKPTKDFFRNSRWTEYHHHFLKKPEDYNPAKIKKSTTPEIQRKNRILKTPKSFLADKANKKNSMSPCRSLLRSTGFNYMQT